MAISTSHFGSGPARYSLLPEIKLFDFEGRDVRVTDLDGNPWWLLIDVCRALGIANPTHGANRLDEDERGSAVVDTLGGPQQTNVINESGLYALIMQSRKPEAKRFRKWVTSEVLPALRKDGAYVIAQAEDSEETLVARGLVAANAAIERLKLQVVEQTAELEEMRPKVEAFLDIADANGMIYNSPLNPLKLRRFHEKT